MTSGQAESNASSHPRSSLATIGLWLAAAAAIAGVLALLLSHAPPRLRLIGLLAGVQGAFCGWLISLAGKSLRMRFSRIALAGGAVFGAASVGLATVLWWQVHARQLTENYKPSKGAAMAAAILNQAGEATDPETQKDLQEYRESLKKAGALPPDTCFLAYLEFRASSIGQGRTGGAILFGAEVLLAALLGAGFARNGTVKPFCETCGDWVSPVRTLEITDREQLDEIIELTGGLDCLCTAVDFTWCICSCQGKTHMQFVFRTDKEDVIRSTAARAEPLQLTEEARGRLAALVELGIGLS